MSDTNGTDLTRTLKVPTGSHSGNGGEGSEDDGAPRRPFTGSLSVTMGPDGLPVSATHDGKGVLADDGMGHNERSQFSVSQGDLDRMSREPARLLDEINAVRGYTAEGEPVYVYDETSRSKKQIAADGLKRSMEYQLDVENRKLKEAKQKDADEQARKDASVKFREEVERRAEEIVLERARADSLQRSRSGGYSS